MITPKMLAGVWEDGPGGTMGFRLDINEDGTGDFRFVRYVCDGSGQCGASGDRITFDPIVTDPPRELFLFREEQEVTFTAQVHEFGFVRDRLSFKHWQKGDCLDMGNGNKLEIPAQWVTIHFYRRSTVA
jgi:hypothetical protein